MHAFPKVLKKIIQITRLIFLVKKNWSWPTPVDVLLFDAAGSELFADCLKTWKVGVLHIRGEVVNIPALVGSFFRKGKRKNVYIDLLIEKYRPRLILTFIDNSQAFWEIKERHPSVITMFVQNGTRGYYADSFELLDVLRGTKTFSVDYMMTFGSRIAREYKKYIKGSAVPMGSFKNNQHAIQRKVINGSIAFISQFRETGSLTLGSRQYTHQEFFGDADKSVLDFLLRYAEIHAKSLYIIPCSNKQSERLYYKRLLSSECNFTDEKWGLNSYQALDTAEVVVTIDSTLGYESLARGSRTAFFSIRSEMTGLSGMTYGWPDSTREEGGFWCNSRDPEAFERILNHLFSITDEEFLAELAAERFSEIMEYDPENTTLNKQLVCALA